VRIRNYIYAAAAFIKSHLAINQREQRPIASRADIVAGKKFRPPLADNNAACGHELTSETFYAQPFADAIAPITDASLSFFMCHNLYFNLANFDACQFLTMADGSMVTFAPFHFEGDLFLAPKMF
jgi:hypothetical protein